MSSVKVVKDLVAIGYWQAITSTESQEYEYHVGINYNHSQGTTTEVQKSFTVSMELGVTFDGSAEMKKPDANPSDANPPSPN